MTLPMPSNSQSFWEKARQAKRLLVLDLGFLGDTVHLLPALWAVRQAWPEAQLHVMVAEHVTQLLEVVPWVDQVWGYPRFPKGPKPWQDLGRIRRLRAANFDAVINLNGSDRSSLLTFLSGAPLRLGRRPQGGGPWHWRFQFTHVVEHPYQTVPVFVQRWQCLRQAGIPTGTQAEFHVSISAKLRRLVGVSEADDGKYVHLSPFTTQDQKELPENELVALINGLQSPPSERRLVVSCAPNARERSKLERLLARVNSPPWLVFPGTLGLLDLASVIAGAERHFGGDSGALHLALMTGVPTVSWFRRYEGMQDWLPTGKEHRTVLGEGSAEGVTDVSAVDLLAAL